MIQVKLISGTEEILSVLRCDKCQDIDEGGILAEALLADIRRFIVEGDHSWLMVEYSEGEEYCLTPREI